MKESLLITLIMLICTAGNAQIFHTTIGEDFPRIETNDIDGNYFSTDHLKGRNSIVVFFGTRCPPCRKEIKALQERIGNYNNKNYNVLLVGSTDNDESLILYRAKHRLTYPMISDNNQEYFSQVADAVIPRTFLLDRNGKIIYQFMGFAKTPFDSLFAKLRELQE